VAKRCVVTDAEAARMRGKRKKKKRRQGRKSYRPDGKETTDASSDTKEAAYLRGKRVIDFRNLLRGRTNAAVNRKQRKEKRQKKKREKKRKNKKKTKKQKLNKQQKKRKKTKTTKKRKNKKKKKKKKKKNREKKEKKEEKQKTNHKNPTPQEKNTKKPKKKKKNKKKTKKKTPNTKQPPGADSGCSAIRDGQKKKMRNTSESKAGESKRGYLCSKKAGAAANSTKPQDRKVGLKKGACQERGRLLSFETVRSGGCCSDKEGNANIGGGNSIWRESGKEFH